MPCRTPNLLVITVGTTGSMIGEKYIRPAAIAAKVITVTENGKMLDKEGMEVTRFGFHSFRHSLASTLMERGEDRR
jgi:integrase